MLFWSRRKFRTRRAVDAGGVRRPVVLAAEVGALEPRTMPSVAIQIDYSYDSGNFFDTQAKRDLLQSAANVLTTRFSDDLEAIVPSGGNTWSVGFNNPATGVQTLVDNPVIPANTIVVYAGGSNLGGQAGLGGPGSYSASGSQAWLNTIQSRGQAGALNPSPTDFAPWGGSVTFDSSGATDWYFGQDTSGLGGNLIDFSTVAMHELGHVLGIGTSPSWTAQVTGSTFTGSASTAANGGAAVPLDPSISHWAQDTLSGGNVPVMVPTLLAGQRHQFTALDFAGLQDVGWAQVVPANQAPALGAIGDRFVDRGNTLTFTATATDPDVPANVLTYSLDPGAPAGATLNPSSGAFSWAPDAGVAAGSYPITVRVTDNGTPALSDTETFNVTVAVPPANAAPVLDPIANHTINELTADVFTAMASDPDAGQQLTFSLLGAPTGAAINPSSGVFTWTPSEAQGPGVFTFTVRVTDSGSPQLSADRAVTITVNDVNAPPVLALIGNRTVAEGSLLAFTATATDTDLPPGSLTYSLDPGAPAGAAIDPVTGAFTWAPSEADGPGTFPITVRVTDNGTPALSDTETFNVAVSEVNTPPILANLAERKVAVGKLLQLKAVAADGDAPANALVFRLVGAPAGATINASTGLVSWRPTTAQGNRRYVFSIVVNDGGTPSLSDSRTVAVNVLAPPKITRVTRTVGRNGTTAINVFFDQALNANSARQAGNYTVLTAASAGGRPSIRVGVTARYNASSRSVTLTLSRALTTPLQLTVRKTLAAANGLALGRDGTFRVQ